jgi:hypothetical protein
MKQSLCALSLLAAPSFAWAQTACEQAFKTVGDPRNGATYMTQVRLPGLSPSVAADQLRLIGAGEGFDVGGQRIDGGKHVQFLFQTRNVRVPLVLHGIAESNGTVGMIVSLARGQTVDPAMVRGSMCKMLGMLESGSAGVQRAAAAVQAHPKPDVRQVTAEGLAAEVEREVKRATRGRPEMAEGNLMALNGKFAGQRFVVDGQVMVVTRLIQGEVELAWENRPPQGLLGIRGSTTMAAFNYQVSCRMAARDAAQVASLRAGEWAKLEGEFNSADPSGITLRDCTLAH